MATRNIVNLIAGDKDDLDVTRYQDVGNRINPMAPDIDVEQSNVACDGPSKHLRIIETRRRSDDFVTAELQEHMKIESDERFVFYN